MRATCANRSNERVLGAWGDPPGVAFTYVILLVTRGRAKIGTPTELRAGFFRGHVLVCVAVLGAVFAIAHGGLEGLRAALLLGGLVQLMSAAIAWSAVQ